MAKLFGKERKIKMMNRTDLKAEQLELVNGGSENVFVQGFKL